MQQEVKIGTIHTRAYRKRHPERVKISRKKVYLKRKQKAFELLGGAFCADCGCDEIAFLEINHINGGGSKEHKKRKCCLADSILSGKRSTDGLNVLCRVCNAIDFLKRKKPDSFGYHIARWEKFTGKKAELLNG